MNVSQQYYEPAETILLTGAGFTKTFGGFLGKEMFSEIQGQDEIRRDQVLREQMLDGDLNYETLYDELVESLGLEHERTVAFTNAIRKAYQKMHEIICWQDIDHKHLCTGACQHFIRRFCWAHDLKKRTFFFTLNQDLFVERYYSDHPAETSLRLPLLFGGKWFNFHLPTKLSENDIVRLPDQTKVDRYKEKFWSKGTGQFMYIKLHGSYGWRSQDGSDVIVTGHAKTEILNREPLLKWYLSLFKEALNYPERRLLVIGYGFGDEHINNAIADAMRDNGLRLHVVSPMEETQFKNMLNPLNSMGEEGKPRGRELWKGSSGYTPHKVTELYDRKTSQLPPRGRQFFDEIGLP